MRGEMVWKHLKQYRKMQWYSSQEIEAYQLEQLKKILTYAFNYCPFYRDRMEKYGLSTTSIQTLADLPIIPEITKTDIVNNYLTIRTSGRFIFTSSKTTGGSTGQAVTIDKNSDALARERAATWRAYEWAGISIGDVQARFWGLPLSNKSLYFSKLVDMISNRSRFSAFNINERSLEEYYYKLVKIKPAYIYGYVSMIATLAEYIINNRYKPIPGLRSIITTSEVLTSNVRDTIEEAFGVRVFNEYGCGEVGSIAHECDYHNMHLMAENVIVEVDTKNSMDGKGGEIIVTDLHNRAMPLIRYRIGDCATLSWDMCECGRRLPLVRKVHGRAYDIIIDPDGNRYHPEVLMYIFEEFKEKNAGIKQFQILQKSPTKLTVNIVPDEHYSSIVDREIVKRIREKVHVGFDVDIKYLKEIPRERSGKMRVIKSELKETRL